MTSAPLIDLDAARRETQYPDGIPVVLGGERFVLPAELPVEALDPLLSEEMDLAGVLQQVLADKPDGADEESIGELVINVLVNRPNLPIQLVQAIKDVFAALFGPEQYERFLAQRPSVPDYLRLAKHLLPLLGVSLGEALGSPDSSESAGETSKPTSPSTAASTPGKSGSGRTKKGSSASGG